MKVGWIPTPATNSINTTTQHWIDIMTINSLGLQVGDKITSNRGDVGIVADIEYNDADECEVNWLGSSNGVVATRISQKYIISVMRNGVELKLVSVPL